jgi:hypothetical protein
MSDRLDAYAARVAAGMQQGAGDVARGAFADIGDTYQEILMADSPIGPPDGLAGTMETEVVETESEHAPAALESDPAPDNGPEIGLDPDADIDVDD